MPRAQAVCEYLVGDEGDAVRHQSTKVLDASLGESQFNHEGIQEPLMPLRDLCRSHLGFLKDDADNCVKD